VKKESIVFGIHAVNSILKNSPEVVQKLFVLQGRHDHRLEKLLKQSQGIERDYLTRKKLEELAGSQKHQGIVACCYQKELNQMQWDEQQFYQWISDTEQTPLILVLDGVKDPHNLGACLRSADAAGVGAVIVPKDNAVGLTPVVSKVACGAAETVPLVAVTNLVRTLKKMQQSGIWVIGTAGEATQSLYNAKLTGPMALVMGAEDKGMRRLTRETCDELIKIPMAGQISSLNVSVATGVSLFEIVRQRLIKNNVE